MFYSCVKDYAAKVLYIKKIINLILGFLMSIFMIILSLNIGLNFIILPGNQILANISIGLYASLPLFIFNISFTTFFRLKIRKMYMNELLEIVSKTKLPKKLPKVVYVYTTHNDFMPARLLQNSKQTYKNYEV
jgi:hypothetical protein